MPEFVFDESMIKDGIASAIANYYRALLIRYKNEAQAKQEVVDLLKELCKPYQEFESTAERL